MTSFSCSHNWFNALHVDVFCVSLHRFVIVTIFTTTCLVLDLLFSSMLRFNLPRAGSPSYAPFFVALHSVRRRIEHFAHIFRVHSRRCDHLRSLLEKSLNGEEVHRSNGVA